jgi:para-nitrobenzyl esterase
MSSVSSEAWIYNFSHVPVGWRVPGCVAFHGLELPYVFGHVEAVTTDTIIFLGATTCPTSTDPMLGPEDDQTALNTVRLWAQFAETGNPSVAGLIDWPAYTPEGDQYLDIAAELEVKTGVANAGVTPGTGQ